MHLKLKCYVWKWKLDWSSLLCWLHYGREAQHVSECRFKDIKICKIMNKPETNNYAIIKKEKQSDTKVKMTLKQSTPLVMHSSFLNVSNFPISQIAATAILSKKIKSNDNNLKALFFFFNNLFFSFLFVVCTAFAVLACLVSEPKRLFRAEQWSSPLSSNQWRRACSLTPPHPVCHIKAGRAHPRLRLRWDRGRSGTSSASAVLWVRPPRLVCEVHSAPREASSPGPGRPPAAAAAGRPVRTHPSGWRSLETEERPGLPGWSARCLTPASCCRLEGLQAGQGYKYEGVSFIKALKGDLISVCYFFIIFHNTTKKMQSKPQWFNTTHAGITPLLVTT